MNLRIAALAAVFTLVAVPLGEAGGKADKDIAMVTFHLEADEGANPKMVFSQMDNGKPRSFMRSPEITLKDMAAFSPFPSGTGDEFGLIFQLKDPGKRRLYVTSLAHQGKYLLAQANGRFVDCVIIDMPVEDGLIVIWRGITLNEVKLLDKALPRIGDKGKEQKKKKTKSSR
ncbi:MAG: hypothetical protein WCP45_13555 [Verrucomicrobiota bacterium]